MFHGGFCALKLSFYVHDTCSQFTAKCYKRNLNFFTCLQFFLKATQLENMKHDYVEAMRHKRQAKDLLDNKETVRTCTFLNSSIASFYEFCYNKFIMIDKNIPLQICSNFHRFLIGNAKA